MRNSIDLDLTSVYTKYILDYWRQVMQTVIQKWGNSLGLRVPQVYAQELGLQAGSVVDIFAENGKLEIVPQKFALEAMLAKVTAANIHAAVETGGAVGGEAW